MSILFIECNVTESIELFVYSSNKCLYYINIIHIIQLVVNFSAIMQLLVNAIILNSINFSINILF